MKCKNCGCTIESILIPKPSGQVTSATINGMYRREWQHKRRAFCMTPAPSESDNVDEILKIYEETN